MVASGAPSRDILDVILYLFPRPTTFRRMRSNWLDRSAAGLSGLCVVHCLAGSLALAVLAPFGDLLGHQVHVWGLLIAMPLALFALMRGWRSHGRAQALLLGALGLASMGAGLTQHGHLGEFLLTASGAALLVSAHILNLRWSRHA